MVLANVPLFRFSFRENMRTYPRSGFRSGGTSECALAPVFRSGGTSAKTTLFNPRMVDWEWPHHQPLNLANSSCSWDLGPKCPSLGVEVLLVAGKCPNVASQHHPCACSVLSATPDPPILAFFGFPCFFSFSVIPCFFVCFPFLSKDFAGSAKRKPLLFLVGHI